jgi:[ribosomal protein S5]-alanine N-acetyltransferase
MINIIINEHISINEFVAEQDKLDLIYHINDPDVARNTLTIPHPYTPEDADFYFNLVKEWDAKHGVPTTFAIRYDGRLIGGIGRFASYGIASHKDELGYYLGKDFRNKGIMTKTVVAFCDFLHQKHGIARIEAGVFEHNPASMQVLKKAGFENMGLHKKYHKKGDNFYDVVLWVKIYE